MDNNKNLTPEEIVSLIGNIANRPDLREVQERQVKEIKELVYKYELALRKIIESFPHLDYCNSTHIGLKIRLVPDYSECDCYIGIASNALGIYE